MTTSLDPRDPRVQALGVVSDSFKPDAPVVFAILNTMMGTLLSEDEEGLRQIFECCREVSKVGLARVRSRMANLKRENETP